MSVLPNLSSLSLGESTLPIGTYPDPYSPKRKKSELRFEENGEGGKEGEKKVPPTLVAKLLKHGDSGRGVTWEKGLFYPGLNKFMETVTDFRTYTSYPKIYNEIQDLTNFKHWEKTNLLPTMVLCDELNQANVRYQALWDKAEIVEGKGYYLRHDWSEKRVFILGDFHGSFHSMLEIFVDMDTQGAFDKESGLLAQDVAVVCLGDLLDRSPYTLECMYLMLRLCRENPTQCVLTAGNHETDERQWRAKNGTMHEAVGEHNNKCPEAPDSLLEKMRGVTGHLPSSLIAKTCVGTVQFNHGSYEEFSTDKGYFQEFEKFLAFEGGKDTLSTHGLRAMSPLQWGDLAMGSVDKDTAANLERKGRPVRSSNEVSAYLQKGKLRLLIRGHSDMANISLLYKTDTEPSEELQKEGQKEGEVELNENAKYSYYGFEIPDPRKKEFRLKGGTFARKSTDFTNEELYDMYTLQFAPNMENFDKNLITKDDQNEDLLSVTIASCPFSKPMPPVSMMSCYAILGCKVSVF